MTDTQCKMIFRYLMTHKDITPKEAEDKFGCMRLASRISDLVDKGAAIDRQWVNVINRCGKTVRVRSYSLDIANTLPELVERMGNSER